MLIDLIYGYNRELEFFFTLRNSESFNEEMENGSGDLYSWWWSESNGGSSLLEACLSMTNNVWWARPKMIKIAAATLDSHIVVLIAMPSEDNSYGYGNGNGNISFCFKNAEDRFPSLSGFWQLVFQKATPQPRSNDVFVDASGVKHNLGRREVIDAIFYMCVFYDLYEKVVMSELSQSLWVSQYKAKMDHFIAWKKRFESWAMESADFFEKQMEMHGDL